MSEEERREAYLEHIRGDRRRDRLWHEHREAAVAAARAMLEFRGATSGHQDLVDESRVRPIRERINAALDAFARLDAGRGEG